MIKPANLQFALPTALGSRLVGDPHADRNPHSNLQFALPTALGSRLVGDPHADRNPHSTTSIGGHLRP